MSATAKASQKDRPAVYFACRRSSSQSECRICHPGWLVSSSIRPCCFEGCICARSNFFLATHLLAGDMQPATFRVVAKREECTHYSELKAISKAASRNDGRSSRSCIKPAWGNICSTKYAIQSCGRDSHNHSSIKNQATLICLHA